MGASSFRCDFTAREFIYFIFRKKKCPECGAIMEKVRCSDIVDGKAFRSNSSPLYIQGRKDVKHLHYKFHCNGCGKEFSLSELADKSRC